MRSVYRGLFCEKSGLHLHVVSCSADPGRRHPKILNSDTADFRAVVSPDEELTPESEILYCSRAGYYTLESARNGVLGEEGRAQINFQLERQKREQRNDSFDKKYGDRPWPIS